MECKWSSPDNEIQYRNAASPFLVKATIKYLLSQFASTRTIRKLETDLYVDDRLTGSDSEEEIMKKMIEDETVMKRGFTLTKWASNCQKTQGKFFDTFEGFQDLCSVKVLGLTWTTEDDSFILKIFSFQEQCLFTKRLLLSMTAKLFDPLGFLTPYRITLKILFQKVWKRGFENDDVLPIEFQENINKWVTSLSSMKEWKIPRCISPASRQDTILKKY